MTEIALMLEGQDGLNWDRFQKIARVCEDAGFVGLYRSDHFTNPQGPVKDSLECWTSLTWLASHTTRLEFGPLVSPVSFHHPANLVRRVAAVDDLSGGRLHFGVGAGWQDREHTSYGLYLGTIPERSARLREAVPIMAHLLRSDEPLTFEGTYYRLRDAVLLPRPRRPGGPRLVIGGSGKKLSLPLAAEYADEWNTAFKTPEQFHELNTYLDSLLDARGRPRTAVRRTMMTRLDYTDLQEVRARVAALGEVGVQRIMLNWFDFDNLDGIAQLARALL
jgi:F420-dependent oxidoreductase-like protein